MRTPEQIALARAAVDNDLARAASKQAFKESAVYLRQACETAVQTPEFMFAMQMKDVWQDITLTLQTGF
jgi:hypothetical protein